MIALVKKFIKNKIASIIGSGNMKQIEQVISTDKKTTGKPKKSTNSRKSS